jgi:hypothetical protein
MRRHFIWAQAVICAVTLSVAAPAVQAGDGQPPPHAQDDKNKNKNKKDKKDKKDKDNHNDNDNDNDRQDGATARNQADSRDWDPRFRGLDKNNNRVVSRSEWDGDDRSFANHDWNRDGVLSGNELVAGARRPDGSRDNRPRNEPDEVLFARMDANRDNSVSRAEWTGSASDFARLDFNKDGVLSPYEYGVGR